MRDSGSQFLEAYVPIVRKHMEREWGPRQKEWQRVRRGRYVEFNLVYDRGTTFGLKTGGRVESILMSLPSDVSWQYDYRPEPGSPGGRAARVDQAAGLGVARRGDALDFDFDFGFARRCWLAGEGSRSSPDLQSSQTIARSLRLAQPRGRRRR